MTYIKGATPISNTDDLIDSRDVIARVQYLRESWAESTGNDPDDYVLSEDDWQVGLGYDEGVEIVTLMALARYGEDYVEDWQYGATLIRETYFEEYVRDLLVDCGYIPADLPGFIAIDWQRTADAVATDYSEVEFDGVTYLVR